MRVFFILSFPRLAYWAIGADLDSRAAVTVTAEDTGPGSIRLALQLSF